MNTNERPFINIASFEPISKDLLRSLPVGLIKKHMVIPVQKRGETLVVAMPKVEGLLKPAGLMMVAGCPVEVVYTATEEIIRFIKREFPDDVSAEKSQILDSLFETANLPAPEPIVEEVSTEPQVGEIFTPTENIVIPSYPEVTSEEELDLDPAAAAFCDITVLPRHWSHT